MGLCADFYIIPKEDVVNDFEFTEFESEDEWADDPREFISIQNNWFLHGLFYDLYASKGGTNKNIAFSVVVPLGHAYMFITSIVTADHYKTERERYFDVGIMHDVINEIKKGNIIYYGGCH